MDEQLKVRRAAAKERARERYRAEVTRRIDSGECGTADEVDDAIARRRGRRTVRKASAKDNQRATQAERVFYAELPHGNKGLRKRKVKHNPRYKDGVPTWDRTHT